MVNTAYAVLGVAPECSQEELKKTFKLISLKSHPDKDPTGNGERFKEALNAYQQINTPEKRAAYDAKLTQEAPQAAPQAAGSHFGQAPQAPNYGQAQSQQYNQHAGQQQYNYQWDYWFTPGQRSHGGFTGAHGQGFQGFPGHVPGQGHAQGFPQAPHGQSRPFAQRTNQYGWQYGSEPPPPQYTWDPAQEAQRRANQRKQREDHEATRQRKAKETAYAEEAYRKAQEALKKKKAAKAQAQQAQAKAEESTQGNPQPQRPQTPPVHPVNVTPELKAQVEEMAAQIGATTSSGHVNFEHIGVPQNDWVAAARMLQESQYNFKVYQLAHALGYAVAYQDGRTIDFQQLGVSINDFKGAEQALRRVLDEQKQANELRQAQLKAQQQAEGEAEAKAQGQRAAEKTAEAAAQQRAQETQATAQAEAKAQAEVKAQAEAKAQAERAREEARVKAEAAAAAAEAERQRSQAQAQAEAHTLKTSSRHFAQKPVIVDLTGSPEPPTSPIEPQSPAPTPTAAGSTAPPESQRKRQHSEDHRPVKRHHTASDALNMDNLELPEDVPEQYRPKPATWYEQGVCTNQQKKALRDAYIKSVDYGMSASSDLFQCFANLRQNVPPLSVFELPQSAEQIGAFLEQVRAPLRELSDLLDRVQAAQAP